METILSFSFRENLGDSMISVLSSLIIGDNRTF